MKFEFLSNILNCISIVNFSFNEALVGQEFERVVSDILNRQTKISKDNLLAFCGISRQSPLRENFAPENI